MTSPGGFYDVDHLEQIAINLFHGWGYNFYRLENQLRADDLLVRSHVGLILGSARKSVEAVLSGYRRAFLAPPTRDNPLPDPTAVAHARTLAELAADIGQLEGAIRALPAPENDRMTQRYREEADTLLRLREFDTQLVGQAETLREMLTQDHHWMLQNEAVIRDGLRLLRRTLEARQLLLG
jgi:cytosine/adenosine deaminase-related metal-dependent hydrolase